MEKLKLKSVKREAKTAPHKFRREGKMPAVLYGHKIETQSLTVNQSEFEKILKKAGESTIIELENEDGKNYPVLIQDVQYHVLNSQPIHADFFAVNMTEKLKATVVLEFTGEAKAVKSGGGVLVKSLNEVEVECLPNDLPHNILVDISKLETFADSIHVKDLKVSTKVHILTNPEEIVAKVQPPRDVEAELSAPIIEDISKVEGAAEDKPETTKEGEKKESK